MKIYALILLVTLAFVPAGGQAMSFIEVQATVISQDSVSYNFVARPTVNLTDRWNLQALAWVGNNWAEMYVGPQYMFFQPTDQANIIQMGWSIGVGLETTNTYCLGSIFEAVGSNWDALAVVEYGDLGLYYKGQFSYGVIGSSTSFAGLGMYGEKGLGVGPRLTWTKIQENDQAIQVWANVIYDPKPQRSFGQIGLTYLW